MVSVQEDSHQAAKRRQHGRPGLHDTTEATKIKTESEPIDHEKESQQDSETLLVIFSLGSS